MLDDNKTESVSSSLIPVNYTTKG